MTGFLLGIEIFISAALMLLGLLVGIQGFLRAGYFIDRVIDGFEIKWLRIALWLCFALSGILLSSGVVIYWSQPS